MFVTAPKGKKGDGNLGALLERTAEVLSSSSPLCLPLRERKCCPPLPRSSRGAAACQESSAVKIPAKKCVPKVCSAYWLCIQALSLSLCAQTHFAIVPIPKVPQSFSNLTYHTRHSERAPCHAVGYLFQYVSLNLLLTGVCCA